MRSQDDATAIGMEAIRTDLNAAASLLTVPSPLPAEIANARRLIERALAQLPQGNSKIT